MPRYFGQAVSGLVGVQRFRDRVAAGRRRNDESGAVLILALIFLVAVSLIVTALLTWVGTSLNATAAFTNERNVESAATDAANLAIQNTRFVFDPYGLLNAAVPQSCLPAAGSATMSVYCTMSWTPYSTYTRTVTYSVCPIGSGTAVTCAAAPVLQAIVGFYDGPTSAGTPTRCQPAASGGSCGTNMSELSWLWHPVVPSVSGITLTDGSPAAGSVSGGTQVLIYGSGFENGETVWFTQQSSSGNGPASGNNGYNQALEASLVPNPPCSGCIEAVSPLAPTGTNYYVTVTTSGGTSPYVSSVVFNYQAVKPTVTGLVGSITGGSTAGSTLVTIAGTGFSNNSQNQTQVFFCSTPSQSSCLPSLGTASVFLPSAGTAYEISALSPPVSTAGNYYVEVEVNNLFSALPSPAVFQYGVQVPIVTNVTPTSPYTSPLTPGESITITGENFISGTTVGFCPETSNAPYYSATCLNQGGQMMVTVVPVSTTEIVVNVPSLGAAGVYFPIVALPAAQYPYSTYPPENPYNEPADEFSYS